MKRLFNRIYFWIMIVWLSSKWVFRTNLGNRVWYRGKKHTVANGVRSAMWRLPDVDNDDGGWVSRSECKLVLSPANLWHSFSWGYNFYMTSWYAIWCREGIKPWMKGCNIW